MVFDFWTHTQGRFGGSVFGTSDKVPSLNVVSGPWGFSLNYGVSLNPFLTVSLSSTVYREVITIPYLGYLWNPIDTFLNWIDR